MTLLHALAEIEALILNDRNFGTHRRLLNACTDFLRANLPEIRKALEDARWIPFAERWPHQSPALDDPSVRTTDSVLVTNNLHSRDRMGRMSHVWFLAPIQSDNGEVVGFTESDRKVHGLTHWRYAGTAAMTKDTTK